MKRMDKPEIDALAERFQVFARVRFNHRRGRPLRCIFFKDFVEAPDYYELCAMKRLRWWRVSAPITIAKTEPFSIN